MANLLKRTDLPDGGILLEFDEMPNPPHNDLLISLGIEPYGWSIEGNANVAIFHPKLAVGAKPIVQRRGLLH